MTSTRPRALSELSPTVPRVLLAATLWCWGCGGDAGPAGPVGPEGPAGPAGPGATGSISAVQPLVLYREHLATIVISGSATQWTGAATVDFGPGVQVTQKTVASPTAIVVRVVADSAATLGVRDVSVTDAGATATFTGAFLIEAPLFVRLSRGSFVSGAFFEGTLHLVDGVRPFHDPEGPAEDVIFYVAERPLGHVSTPPATSRSVDFISFVALDDPGPIHLVVEADFQRSRTPGLTPIQPTTVPAPLGATTDFQAGPIETVIHRIDAPGGKVVSLSFDDPVPLGPGGFGPLLITPDSAFDVFSGRHRFYGPSPASWFLSVNVANDVDYSITVDTASVTPKTLDAGPVVGSLAGPFGSDWYEVTVAVGESVSADLSDGPTDTCAPGGDIDAALRVTDALGRWVTGGGPGCASAAWGPVAAAGTYYLEVYPAPGCVACAFDYEIAAQKN